MTSSRITLQALQALPDFPYPPAGTAGSIPLTIHLHDRMEPLEEIWRRLEAEPTVSLHQGYDWCHAWSSVHRLPLLIIEGRRDQETVFLLPLEITRRHGSRIARFIGAPHNNMNTGLLAPGLEPIDRSGLTQALRLALAGRVDLLTLARMPLAWRQMLSPFRLLEGTENHNHSFQFPLLERFEDTLKQVNAKRKRKKFRVQQRRLENAGGYTVFRAETQEERHGLLDEFFRQKAERFRTKGLPDVFRDAQVQAFFHALLDTPAAGTDTPLTLHALRMNGEHEGIILAVVGVSRKGDHMICQFGSIREDIHNDTSPGEFLFWHVIENACQTGATLFDFGIGDQPYKRSWCTIETVQYNLLVPLTLKGELAAALQRGIVRATAAVKRNPKLYAFVQRLRAGPAPGSDPPDDD